MTHPSSCRCGKLRATATGDLVRMAAAVDDLGDGATLDALVRLALRKAAK